MNPTDEPTDDADVPQIVGPTRPRRVCVWTGAVSSDMSDPRNWRDGIVPATGETVYCSPVALNPPPT